jgi:hypothetical protein
MKNIFNLREKAMSEQSNPLLERFAQANDLQVGDANEGKITQAELEDRLKDAQEFVYAQFTGETFDGQPIRNLPPLKMEEALTTADTSVIFPRVISTILQEPKEPALWLTNNIAEVLPLPENAPLSVEFPTTDALSAFEMAEGQEYPQQTLSFQQHMYSIRLRKYGVASSVTEETIKQSMWPLVTMNLRMMANAIDRRIESTLYQAMVNKSQVVFDNATDGSTIKNTGQELSSPSIFHTTGVSIVGGAAVPNGSFSYYDLVKMCGVLLGNRHEGTHFLAHPLAWPIFAQDPYIKAIFFTGGQLGGGVWTRQPQFDQQVSFPFGIQYVPYYALPYKENSTVATGTLSGNPTALVTDLYLLDKANSLLLATRGGTEMDQMDNWFRDAKMMKARKYAGVSAKLGGKGMCVARNVKVVENQAALYTVRQQTS